MRRSVLSLFGLILGAMFLVALKTPSLGTPLSGVAGAPQNPGQPLGGAPGRGSGGPGTSGPIPASDPGPGQTPKPGTSQAQPGPTPHAGQSTPIPGQSTATTPPAGGTTTTAPSTTATGAAVAVRTAESPTARSSPCGNCADYTISVTITVTGGRITSTSVSYNPSPGESQQFANQANTQLSQSILTAQTWNLGRVSGATYAGNAWEQSVRDAMSKAGLPV